MAIFHGQRPWVYPLKVKGRFTRWHKGSSALLFAFLMIVPWLRIGGEPVFLFDVGGRQLNVLGHLYTATDGILILLTALSAAFALFLFTSLWGRLWCGYFCPQSVFMLNLVYPIEELFEGDRGTRMRRNSGPWTADKLGRKVAKWVVYAAIAVFVSMSFMGFFVPTELLWTGQGSSTVYFFIGLFSFVWFWDFAWYREQTCNFICPYARFQGALTDDESLVISYDTPRGEPRGKAARERGGCIDCKKCVTVCPQGIDIRDGFQLECIACGRCIDACADVMDKLGHGHPTLVRYTTIASEQGRVVRWIRPRTIAYGTLLSVLAAGFTFVLSNHEPVEVLVDRVPGSLFIEDADGFVRNMYLIRVLDRSRSEGPTDYTVAVEGLPEGSEVKSMPISVSPGQQAVSPLILRVPRDQADATMAVHVTVRGGDASVVRDTTFKGPGEAVAHAKDDDEERDDEVED